MRLMRRDLEVNSNGYKGQRKLRLDLQLVGTPNRGTAQISKDRESQVQFKNLRGSQHLLDHPVPKYTLNLYRGVRLFPQFFCQRRLVK